MCLSIAQPGQFSLLQGSAGKKWMLIKYGKKNQFLQEFGPNSEPSVEDIC